MADDNHAELVPFSVFPPPSSELMKLTKDEAMAVRGSLDTLHPVTRFLDRVPEDELNKRTRGFRKVATAINAQIAATKAALKLEQMEGYVVSLDELRARNAMLIEQNFVLLESAEEDATEIEALHNERDRLHAMVKGLVAQVEECQRTHSQQGHKKEGVHD